MDFLLKANAVIIIFFLFYKLFLQRETFFQTNRYFLLTGLITSLALPFVVIPVYVEKTVINAVGFHTINAIPYQVNEVAQYNLTSVLAWLYVIGVIVFLIKFLIELISLCFLIINNKKEKQAQFIFIKTSKNHSPFSFFKYIVYNPNQFTTNELEQIIIHEKIHATQYHSIDILLTKIVCSLFWFNPFIWLYNKTLQQNLEFIADSKTQQKMKHNKTYQTLLLKAILPAQSMAIANHFYNSLIKKRIIMLHKSKSNKLNTWKYVLILPILALFLMSFNTKDVIVEKPIKSTIIPIMANNVELAIVDKNATNDDLKAIEKQFQKNGVTLAFKSVKRNSKNEIIRIKITASVKGSTTKYETNSDTPISKILIKYNSETNDISIGNSSKTKELHLVSKKGNKHKTKTKAIIFSGDENDSNQEDEIEVIIEKPNDNIHLGDEDNVFIIKKGDEHKIIEIKENTKEVTVTKDENGKVIKKIIIKDDGTGDNKWIGEDVEEFILKDKGNKKMFFITSGNDKEPLIIVNDKEVSKDFFDVLNPNDIKKINVLKGKAATKLHGEKAKDGVIIVETK